MTLAYEITKAYGGDWRGNYGVLPGPGHSVGDRSVIVSDRPANPDDVCVHSFAGDDFRDIKDHWRADGLLPERSVRDHYSTPNYVERIQRRAALIAREAEETAERRAVAKKIWDAALAAPHTIVGTYLRNRRIILPPPAALRFAPSLRHWKSGRFFPAIVAAVTNSAGEFLALHRTYLAPGGRGKAGVESPKMMLGPAAGGAVQLADAGATLAVAEGIETALSFMQVEHIPTWATLSTSGLKALQLPNTVCHVIIAADRDKNHAGELAAQIAAERFTSEGRRVEIVLPPKRFGDFNDALAKMGAKNG